MHTRWIVGNFKANKNLPAMKDWLAQFEKKLQQLDLAESVRAVLAPPAPLLAIVAEWRHTLSPDMQRQVLLGAQDVSQFGAGSYTGAVTAYALESFGVSQVIVGHSERRKYFYETSQTVAAKVTQCLDFNLQPIVCVDTPYLAEQLENIEKSALKQCVIAYEPLSAIGTGKNADIANVRSVVADVRLVQSACPVLYGGSTNEQNVSEYFLASDGVLVGGSTLDAKAFAAMIAKA